MRTQFGQIRTLHDIIERKRMEAALRESEERYRQVFENLPDALFLLEVTEDGRFRNLALNPAFERAVGIPAERLIGRYVDETVDADTAQRVITKYRQCVESGTIGEYEAELTLPVGRRWFRSTLIPVRDETGRVARIVGMTCDITARKRMENALQASEEKFRTVFESANDGIFLRRIVERGGETEFIMAELNQKGCELWGHSREEILSGNVELLTLGDPPYTFEEATRRLRLVAAGQPQVFDWQLTRKDGSKAWGEVSLRRIRIGGEDFILSVMRDISERKAMEEALYARQEEFRALVENSPDGVVRYNCAGQRVYVNPAVEALAGKPATELIGTTPAEMFIGSPETGRQLYQAIQRAFRTGAPMEIELTWNTAGGTVEHHQFQLVPEFDPDGRVTTVLGVGRDITTLRETELILSQVAESAPGMVGTYLLRPDGTGCMPYASPRIWDIYGVRPEDVVQDASVANDRIHPDDVDGVMASIAESARTLTPWRHEYRICHPKRGEVWAEGHTTPRRQPDGSTIWYGFVHDITERKQAEEIIRQNEARLAEAADIAQLGYWEFDHSTMTFTFTDQLYALFRTTAEEQGGYQMSAAQYTQRFVHPDDSYVVGAEMQKAIETTDSNYTVQLEHRIIRADGSEGYIAVRFRIIKDEQGQTVKAIGINQDISERKRNIQQIEMLSFALNNSYEGIFIAEENSLHFLYINDSACRLLGYSHEELMQLTAFDFDPDLITDKIEQLQDSAEIGTPVIFESRHKTKDGRIFPVEITATTYQYGDNNYVLSISRDITERKQAEETILRNEARLAEAADMARLGYWEFEYQTQMFTVTDQVWAIFRTTAEEQGGYQIPAAQFVQKFVHPDDAHIAGAEIRKGAESTEPDPGGQVEYRIIRADGSEGFNLVRYRVIKDEQSRPVKAIGIGQDITDRKQDEARINQALTETQGLLEAAQAILGTPHIRTICQQLLIHCYRLVPAAESYLFLVDHAQRQITAWMRGNHLEDPDWETGPLNHTYDELEAGISGQVFRSKQSVLSVNANDGIEPPATIARRKEADSGALIVLPLLARGEVIGTVTVINHRDQPVFTPHDQQLLMALATQAAIAIENARLFDQAQQEIAERTRAEAELQRAKDDALDAQRAAEAARRAAEMANQAKTEFLANMSHEIRTPMNALLGFTDILKGQVTDPQLQYYASLIHDSGQTLLRLLNDILDLSKIEAGKLDLQYSAVNLRQVCRDVAQIFSQHVSEKGLDFVLEVNPELPEYLLFDEIRLRQILLNLVGNAVKFTETGSITLKIEYCQLNSDDWKKATAPDQSSIVNLQFSIIDTGIGIPDDQRETIFGAFEQARGHSHAYGGTGLGLAISKRLAEMMGGVISVAGTVGHGSCFTVRFANVRCAEGADHPAPPAALPLETLRFAPATILIADDVPDNRLLLRRYLEEFGLMGIEAANGQDAIDLAARARPVLILMDIRMPGMNGVDATRLIKHTAAIRDIPVIAVTGTAMKESVEHILTVCDGYLSKPVEKAALVAELVKFLPHTRAMPPAAQETSAYQPDAVRIDLAALDPEAVRRLPEARQLLETTWLPRWQTFRAALIINDVNRFAVELAQFAREYRLQIIQNYAERLSHAAQMYDISGVKKRLAEFPGLVEQLTDITE